LQIPLDPRVRELSELPYTISFIIRKRQQIDSLNELPKEKKPTEDIIWNGTPEEMEEWLEKVFDSKHKDSQSVTFDIKQSEIEG
jgi:hypothetical protein